MTTTSPRRLASPGREVKRLLRARVIGRPSDVQLRDRGEDLIELVDALEPSAAGGRRCSSANSVSPTASRCLRDRQVRKRRRQRARRVMELAPAGVGATHRGADVDHQVEIQIGVGVVLLDVQAVVTRVELPVQVPEVVARARTRGARRTRRSSPGRGCGGGRASSLRRSSGRAARSTPIGRRRRGRSARDSRTASGLSSFRDSMIRGGMPTSSWACHPDRRRCPRRRGHATRSRK